jgi:hypothetical protein
LTTSEGTRTKSSLRCAPSVLELDKRGVAVVQQRLLMSTSLLPMCEFEYCARRKQHMSMHPFSRAQCAVNPTAVPLCSIMFYSLFKSIHRDTHLEHKHVNPTAASPLPPPSLPWTHTNPRHHHRFTLNINDNSDNNKKSLQ